MSKNKNNVIIDMVTVGDNQIRIPEGLDAMLGVEKANVLVRLLYRFQYCIIKGIAYKGYFCLSQDELLAETNISENKQVAIIDKLKKLGLITVSKSSRYEPKMLTFTEENIKNIKDMVQQGQEKIKEVKKEEWNDAFIEELLSEI